MLTTKLQKVKNYSNFSRNTFSSISVGTATHQLQCSQMCNWSGSNHVSCFCPRNTAKHLHGLPHQTVSKEEQVSQNKFPLLFHTEGEWMLRPKAARFPTRKSFSLQTLAILKQVYGPQLNFKQCHLWLR